MQGSCSKQLQEKTVPIVAVIHKWFIFTMGFYILSILQRKSGTFVLRDPPGKEPDRIGQGICLSKNVAFSRMVRIVQGNIPRQP